MIDAHVPDSPPRRSVLWFGLLGGAIAWVAHFLLAAVISEFGCLAGWGEISFQGITAIAWAILMISVVMLLIAVAATAAARGSLRQLRAAGADRESSEFLMARLGWITSAVFSLIIAVQTVPIFYYLGSC